MNLDLKRGSDRKLRWGDKKIAAHQWYISSLYWEVASGWYRVRESDRQRDRHRDRHRQTETKRHLLERVIERWRMTKTDTQRQTKAV